MSSSARGRGQVPALQVRVLSWRLTTRRAHNGRRVREAAPYGEETGAISPPVSGTSGCGREGGWTSRAWAVYTPTTRAESITTKA